MSEASSFQEVLELGGIKIPIDPHVISPGIAKAVRVGTFEKQRLKGLANMVETGDRILDIGGGIGFTSALMAMTHRPELVVSVEGNPTLQTYAARLHALNGVPDVVQRNALAVTTRSAPSQSFHLSADYWGSSMIPDVKAQIAVVEVPVLTYGDMIDDYRPNMLVIDLEVMRGYLQPEAVGGPLEAMELTGVDKVVLHLPMHLGGPRGIKRVFDFFSAQDFYYNIDHSRAAVVLFSRIAP